ncbi:LysR substrate-binding domain-containing protein [Methylobacterium aquaticum]|uniref:LysR substrate-binding domain-containing protein n=1 Tax=Methylobacterium aquaticum TaxID=270351 RepID=UPI003D170B74
MAGRAAALLSHAEEAENAARDEGAEPHGLVRIAAPMRYGISHVAPLRPRLAVDLPGVSVNLDLDDAPVDLVAKGVDIAVRIRMAVRFRPEGAEVGRRAITARRRAVVHRAVWRPGMPRATR